jgi:hypothetical protein
VALGARPGKEIEAMFEADMANATEFTRESWVEQGDRTEVAKAVGRALAYWL